MVSLSVWEVRIHFLLLKSYKKTKQIFKMLHLIGDMIQVLLPSSFWYYYGSFHCYWEAFRPWWHPQCKNWWSVEVMKTKIPEVKLCHGMFHSEAQHKQIFPWWIMCYESGVFVKLYWMEQITDGLIRDIMEEKISNHFCLWIQRNWAGQKVSSVTIEYLFFDASFILAQNFPLKRK